MFHMRKLKFLVMAEEISSDYAKQVIEGISDFCRQKDIDCIVFNVRHPKFRLGTFEYQFWAGSSLINTKEVDVIIVLSGIYCSTYSPEEFAELLKTFGSKKIISISQKLPLENSWCVLADNEKIFHKAFDFLVNTCGSKRIGFMTASRTSSVESAMRFNAYKSCLKEHGMKYDDSIVFHGRFTIDSACEELENRLGENCSSVDFDTIIAANDQMALGIMAFLKDHNIKVPEQVMVMGYDNINEAAAVKPTLSSMSPFNYNLGYNASKIAFDIANGAEVPRELCSEAKLVIRESTGYDLCQDKFYLGSDAINQLVLRSYDNAYIYYLLDAIQCNETTDVFLRKTCGPLNEVGIKKFAVVLYENPIYYKKWSEFSLPEKVRLAYAFENGSGTIYENEFFSPSENILPLHVFSDSSDTFIAQSVYYGEKQYGYLLYAPGERGLGFYDLYTKALSNALANAYEYTIQYEKNIRLQKEKIELEQTSRTDELTGVLNRRGFDYAAQKQIDIAVASLGGGVLIYGDMNHLKFINDRYGHEFGDKAIRAEAEVLKETFRSTDIIGRLGGDEFAVVAVGLPIEKIPQIREKLTERCAAAIKKYDFPFDLSISIGAVEFSGDLYDLNELLKLADEKQYIEKRAFHESERT